MSLRLLIVGVAVFIGAAAAEAAEKRLTDLYGDPLPEGALLRLGTSRLRSSASLLFFTPDGRTLVARDDESRTVKWWNPEDGALRKVFALPMSHYLPEAISPDGKLYVNGDDYGGVEVRDVTSGAVVSRLPTGVCHGTAFSAGDATLAVWEWNDRPIRIWDFRSGKKRVSSEKNYQPAQAFFSPDGSRLIASDGKAVSCLDTATGKELWRVVVRTWQIDFAPNGKSVAAIVFPDKKEESGLSSEERCEVRFLNAVNGKPDGHVPLPCSPECRGLCYSPDGSALAWRTPQDIMVWNLKAGKVQRSVSVGPDGDPSEPFTFAPDGQTLIGRVGRTLHLWGVATGKDLYQDVSGRGHNAPVVAVAWSHDGKQIATMSQGFDASLCIWDAATGKLLRTLPASRRWRFQCDWLTFTPDDARLLAAGGDRVVHCWDASTGKEVWNGTADDPKPGEKPHQIDGFHLTADGKRLIALGLGSTDGGRHGPEEQIEWNALTGERGGRRQLPKASQSDVFSPDDRLRVLGTGEVYDEQAGVVRRTLKALHSFGHPYGGPVGAFSPDGALFAAPCYESPKHMGSYTFYGAQVWETATGKPLMMLPDKEFGRLAFSPDGRTITMVGEKDIRAWDAVTGAEVYRQPVGDRLLGSFCASAAFSPDGRRLVTACADTSAVVWDLSSAIRRPASAPPLTTKEIDDLWRDLADDDAPKAYAAIDRLAARPKEAVVFLGERLRPAEGLSPDRLKRLLAGLDDDSFDKREAASRQLAVQIEQAEQGLRDALKQNLTAEQRNRVTDLLKLATAGPVPETRRGLRAVRVLTAAGTPEARAVLEKLAGGAAEDALTRAAQGALDRWK